MALDIKGRVCFNEPLAGHTSFRIGGPADIWAVPADNDDLKAILDFCRRAGIAFFLIGRGSNVLIKDAGYRGVAIHLGSAYFSGAHFDNHFVTAGAGIDLGRLLYLCRSQGLGGCEFLAGIPGTLGGAIMGNTENIGNLAEEVRVMNAGGEACTLKREKLQFSYRSSNLAGYIILGAKLRLEKQDKKEIARRVRERLRHKQKTQDLAWPSAGCVFKNPREGKPAGYLIEKAGLKGMKVRDAQVSKKHANFIINRKHAASSDVIELMRLIREKVKEEHGVSLEPEIRII